MPVAPENKVKDNKYYLLESLPVYFHKNYLEILLLLFASRLKISCGNLSLDNGRQGVKRRLDYKALRTHEWINMVISLGSGLVTKGASCYKREFFPRFFCCLFLFSTSFFFLMQPFHIEHHDFQNYGK